MCSGWRGAGSRIARVPRGRARLANEVCGTTLESPIDATCAKIPDTVSVSTTGRAIAPDSRKDPVKLAAVVHRAWQQHEVGACRFGPVDLRQAAPWTLGGSDEHILLAVQPDGSNPAQGFAVDIGDPDIDVEVVQAGADLSRGHRFQMEADQGMLCVHRCGDQRSDTHGRRDGADAQRAGEAFAHARKRLLQESPLGQNPSSPEQYLLALRSEAFEALLPADDLHAELGLELADTGGQGRLGDVARLGCAPEVPLPRKRDEIVQLTQLHLSVIGLVRDRGGIPGRGQVEHPRVDQSR